MKLPSPCLADVTSFTYTSPRSPFSVSPDLDLLSFVFSTTSKATFHHQYTAIADSSSAESLTFLELQRLIRSAAGALSFLGIRQHDVVLIVSPNSIHFPVAFFAVISLGAIATFANPLNTSKDILKQASHSHAKLIITVSEVADKVRHSGLPILLTDVHSHAQSLSEAMKNSAHHKLPTIRIRQTDPAAFLYTSGTTGVSKAAVISHKNCIVAALQVKLACSGADTDLHSSISRCTFLCCIPMFHAFGLSVTLIAQLHMGNTIISMPKYTIDGVLQAMEAYQVTHLAVVPPILVALAKHEGIEKYDLRSVGEVVCGAGHVNGATMAEIHRRMPNALIRLDYGMTEASGRISITSRGSPPGSVGQLVSGMEALVVDPDTSKLLEPNKPGELWIRGPNIMQGYLDDQQATASTIDRDGWLHTGDLVFFDNEGNLHIVGRLKDLIKYKGLQVAPAELEALLMKHDAIMDAAVVAFPDEYAGEIPMAFVVQAAGACLTELDVIRFVEGQVAPYKKIRRVKFVDKLPKTASGKVIRHELVLRAKL